MNNEPASFELTDQLEAPIPELPTIAGWKEIRLHPTNEKLVPLGIFSDNDDIFTSAVYAAEYADSPYVNSDALDSSLVTMFVRESVASKLRHAQQLLPQGYHLVVYDSYRSLEVQGTLYKQYYSKLQELYPDWTDEQLSIETQKYVSIPSDDLERPSPHNTGGSVDVALFKLEDSAQKELDTVDVRLQLLKEHMPTDYSERDEVENPILREYYLLSMKRVGIVKSHARVLDFRTEFDNGTGTSALRYYEELATQRPLSNEERDAARNRRMLYNVMVDAGMVPYEDEWWHFNAPESQMGAKVIGAELASFGAMQLTEDNKEFEAMRKSHLEGFRLITDRLRRGLHVRTYSGLINDLIELNEEAAAYGMIDPQLTTMPKAAKIAPEKAA